MANEASRIENPDSTPGAVSTGYQRQNTLLTSLFNGIDCSVIEGGVGEITIKISGPIDVNGVLYSIASEAVLALSGGAANYVVYLDGTGVTLTPTLTTTPGSFDSTKNAHYTAGGKRILNWMIQWDGVNARVYKLGQDQWEDTLTANGTWTAMFSKVYEIWVTGKGGNGGDATVTGSNDTAGAGGGAGLTGKKKIYIKAGDEWTSVFSAISGGNTSISDGATTLTAQNGYDGQDAIDTFSSKGGKGGFTSSGFDFSFGGNPGESNTGQDAKGSRIVSNGAGSYYGGGGLGADSGNSDGGDAKGYGSGGGGALRLPPPPAFGTNIGGTGASGIIRIIG